MLCKPPPAGVYFHFDDALCVLVLAPRDHGADVVLGGGPVPTLHGWCHAGATASSLDFGRGSFHAADMARYRREFVAARCVGRVLSGYLSMNKTPPKRFLLRRKKEITPLSGTRHNC